jgi:type III restriction enzyme
VTTIVGLRAYVAQSNILPEQTLGRGLRKMFFGTGRGEKVSVLGTPAFLDFVETIRNEGVELETRPMGPNSPGNGPMVIEPDKSDPGKVERLDIELPKLKARIERNMLRLEELDPATVEAPRLALRLAGRSRVAGLRRRHRRAAPAAALPPASQRASLLDK